MKTLSIDAVTANSVLVGGTVTPKVTAHDLLLSTISNQVVNLPLWTLDGAHDPEGDGDILAGIPTIDLTVADPTGLGALLELIVFIGISHSTDGGATWTLLHDQFAPFRGYGNFSSNLVGVLERFNHGDLIGLAVYSGSPDQFGTSGTKPAAMADIKATVRLPLIGTRNPVPKAAH